MKVAVQKLSEIEYEMKVEIPKEKVQEQFQQFYQYLQQNAALKGFRKGKVPVQTLKTMYKDYAHQSVSQELIQNHIFSAMEDQKLTPTTKPQIHFDTIQENEVFAFSAKFEAFPPVQLQFYEKLSVQKEILELSDQDLQHALDGLRERHFHWIEESEDKFVEKGHQTLLKFNSNDEKADLLKSLYEKEHPIVVGEIGLAFLEDALIGMKKGESKEIDWIVPKTTAQDEEIKIKIQVAVLKVSRKEIHDLNDELAQHMGLKDLEDLKSKMREELVKVEESRIQSDLKERLVEALIHANPMSIPSPYIERQKDLLKQDFIEKLKKQNPTMSEEEVQSKTLENEEHVNKTAKFLIHSTLLINEISQKFNLRCTSDDFEKFIKEKSLETGLPAKKIKDFYSKEETKHEIEAQITRSKVVNFLLSKAVIKEVARSELVAPQKFLEETSEIPLPIVASNAEKVGSSQDLLGSSDLDDTNESKKSGLFGSIKSKLWGKEDRL